MRAVILAGGRGSRLSEETALKPKPMVEIGGKPILWHIMKIYSAHGVNDFIVCLGYKGYLIKEFFANYFMHASDVTFDLANNKVEVHRNSSEPWRVTLVDTGDSTMTGGRLKRIEGYLRDEADFCFTYGDGVSDINITKVIEFHRARHTAVTVTATQLSGRFGALKLEREKVVDFKEKPAGDGSWVSGGFFVLTPKVFSYIAGDDTAWEQEPLERLAHDGQVSAYRHSGFWQPMDTMYDRTLLEGLWAGGKAPWKVW
ncbi:MAG: glucose-1-phosphate cytidylyltransferase [Terracidiphilus sp.]